MNNTYKKLIIIGIVIICILCVVIYFIVKLSTKKSNTQKTFYYCNDGTCNTTANSGTSYDSVDACSKVCKSNTQKTFYYCNDGTCNTTANSGTSYDSVDACSNECNPKDKYTVENGDVTKEGENTVITFKQDGKFTPKVNMSVNVFAVGGGGAGGISLYWNGSGGGSGGGIVQQEVELTSNTGYDIKIGSGGVNDFGTDITTTALGKGNDTSFGTTLVAPGGNPATNSPNNFIGGSSAIVGQNGNGGNAVNDGAGLPGILNNLSTNYGGGGGGGGHYGVDGGTGVGGGGNGGNGGTNFIDETPGKFPTNGSDNTGGGGGGWGGSTVRSLGIAKSGNGGSGIVILTFKTNQ